MSLFVLLLSTTVAAGVSYALTPATIWFAQRVGAIDQPSDRKVHASPIPRLGGLAVLIAAAVAVSIQLFVTSVTRFLDASEFWLALAVGLLPIIAISFRDDIRPVRAVAKLLAQLTGAGIAVALGIRLAPDINLFGSAVHIGWLAIPLSIIWLVGVTNSFNLVDGLDGLSGGLAFISAVSLGAISVVARRPEMATASFILAGALAGFLPFNIHPARVFLGDTGATAVGFTLAALALRGGSTLSAGMAILVPVLVVGLPLAETLVSMARRSIRRLESHSDSGVMDADRNHFHHRLITLGLTHRQAVLVLYGCGLLFAACAIVSLFLTYRNAAVLLVVFLIGAVVGLHKLGYDEFALVRRGTVLKAYEVPVLRSTLFVVFVDVMLCVAALYSAFVLKYDDFAIRSNRNLALQMLPVVVGITTTSLLAFRVYRASWRSASVEDLMRPGLAVITAAAASFLVTLVFNAVPAPGTLYVIHSFVLVGLLVGSRASHRLLTQWNRRAVAEGESVLIYGAGVGGCMALRETLSNPDLRLKPIGFIDDDPHLRDRFVNGLPVLGSFANLTDLLTSTGAAGVIIASDKLPPARVDAVRTACEASGRWLRHFMIRVAPTTERRPSPAVENARIGESPEEPPISSVVGSPRTRPAS